MGYNLKIGEALYKVNEDGEDRVYVDEIDLPYAPAFGEPTDFTNARWPSYSSWFNAMDNLDMVDLMFNERNGGNSVGICPLIQEHPGYTYITQDHLNYAKRKLCIYKMNHPDHIAEFPAEEIINPNPIYDGNLCRAEWLIFWLDWAIKNCKNPVFVNT